LPAARTRKSRPAKAITPWPRDPTRTTRYFLFRKIW
jgi:hypothetical protein